MTGPLLRTGTLAGLHPLGAVGHPVYLAAAQLRTAIARRLGPQLADLLAIPQRHEDGALIDWYAPHPGPVVPWSAASSDERAAAWAALQARQARIQDLAERLRGEPDHERQVFGRLLAQVTRFPAAEYLYLVDGEPVLTFWGFVQDETAPSGAPLLDPDCLIQPAVAGRAPQPGRWWRRGALLLGLIALLLVLALLALRACVPVTSAPVPSGPSTGRPIASGAPGLTPASTDPGRERSERQLTDAGDTPLGDPAITRVGPGLATGALAPAKTDRLVLGAAARAGSDLAVAAEDADTARADLLALPPATGLATTVADPIAPESQPVESQPVGAQPGVVSDPVSSDPTALDLALPDADPVAAAGAAPETIAPSSVDATAAVSDGPVDAPGADAEAMADTTVAETAALDAALGAALGADQDTPLESAAPAPADPNAAADPFAHPDPAPNGPVAAATAPESAAMPGPGGAGPRRRVPRHWLDRDWRAATRLQDPTTGLPIQLDYLLRDGSGQVRLTRHDDSRCEGAASARIADDRLLIDSTTAIDCADGTSFGRPQVVCEPGPDGRARCRGRYPDGTGFAVELLGGD